MSTKINPILLDPAGAANGAALVYNSANGVAWGAPVSAGGGGVTAYETLAELPLSGNSSGDMAYVEENNRLYLWTGVGWFNIALINTNPSITTGPNAGYTLAKDGTPTVLTLVASDPEGVPITWSSQVTTGTLGNTAVITQNNNVFTITPSANTEHAGTFGVTFTASDGVNIATAASSFTLVFTAADQYYNRSILLTTTSTNNANNNTFVDTAQNRTITRFGNTTQGSFTPFSPAGWSAYFDGSGDFVTVADNNLTRPGSGDFTLEMYYYYTGSNPTGYVNIFSYGASGDFLRLFFFTSNTLILWNGSTPIITSPSNTLVVNTWQHVAITRSGSTVRLFANGVNVGSATSSTNYATGVLSIGGETGQAGFLGYMSNFRLVRGTALHTANFTPSTVPLTAVSGTSLLTLQDHRFRDRSTNNFAITRNGGVRIEAISPFLPDVKYDPLVHGGSAYFDGTGDYLTTPSAGLSDFYQAGFTVEAWIYPTAETFSTRIITSRNPAAAAAGSWGFNATQTSLSFTEVAASETGVSATVPSLSFAWHHIAACRSGTITKIFLDGVQVASATQTTNFGYDTGNTQIGTSPSTQFPGYIMDVRVSNYRSTTASVYTADFTPPTAPLGTDVGPVFLMNTRNAGIFDETGRIEVETLGNARASTSVVKYGNTSIFFDGTGDYLSAPYDPVLMDWWTSNYTLEAWVYPTSFSGWSYLDSAAIKPVLIGNKEFNSAGNYWGFGLTTTGTLYFAYFNGSSQGAGTSSTATLNTWNHIAMVKNGANITLYLNGVGTSIGNVVGTPQSAANTPLTIGAGNNTYINGYVQDLRITKGIARYTANFTPPTAKLGYDNAE